jgi:hypothetical protein
VLEHARQLDHFSQLDLTPLTAHARRPKGAHQVLRFLLQLLLCVADEAEQGSHVGAVVDPRLLDFLELGVDLLEGVLDR